MTSLTIRAYKLKTVLCSPATPSLSVPSWDPFYTACSALSLLYAVPRTMPDTEQVLSTFCSRIENE